MKSAIRLACVLLVCLAMASTTRLVQSASATKDVKDERGDRFSDQHHGDDGEPHDIVRLATGQFVTPTAIRDSACRRNATWSAD